jgi:uncharacterized protein (TIGR02001 family)
MGAGSSLLRPFIMAGVMAIAGSQACAQISGNVSLVSGYWYRGAMLSNAHPQPQLHLGYDGKDGWYAGGFASGVDLGPRTGSQVQLMTYAGYLGHLPGDIRWEAGLIKSAFLNAAAYNYLEGFAGILSDNLSARLYFSPDYFGARIRTIYAELNGSYPLMERIQLVGHVGHLQIFPDAAGRGPESRSRHDISIGLSAGFADWSMRVAWVAGRPYADGPQFYGTPKPSAWILSVSTSF